MSSAKDSTTPQLIPILADICKAISGADYERARELFALTAKNTYPPDIASLAEAFGMMLVKVEAREFQLEKIAVEYEETRKELALFQTKLKSKVLRTIAKKPMGDIIAYSAGMQDIMRQAVRIAQVKATVLITGETGTGKGLLAQTLHFGSDRAKEPFVSVNCAAIPETLLESELFGIEKGVATGVVARIGRFEQANGGTIFLDEIGDMSLDSQAKILHVIENSVVERVGGRQSVPVDVRIIAATHRDLPAMCEKNSFRSDLYYRLNVLRLHIPPLRERREDIPFLVRHFLDNNISRHPEAIRLISNDALQLLSSHDWPGNIREMENEIERASLLARGVAITPQDLSPIIKAPVSSTALPDIAPFLIPPFTPVSSRKISGKAHSPAAGERVKIPVNTRPLREVELDTVRAALAEAGGNKTLAANILGITREGFRKMLKRLSIP
jgi:transcriptional regulator with PAS, ATPase and Fis domain